MARTKNIKRKHSKNSSCKKSNIGKNSSESSFVAPTGSKAKLLTVGLLKQALQQFPDNLPLIYSRDDEGNEFQHVYFSPTTMFVKNSDFEEGRFRDVHNNKSTEFQENPFEFTKCVVIN
jgi:hypothetical protein